MQKRLASIACAAAVAAVATLSGSVPQAVAETNPFAKMAGSWKGGGTFEPLSGEKERVICRVQYNVSGDSIQQDINCAGTDYRI
ncbi:MAG: hypothetical protein VX871_10780, partial [Pseudomonadota bacterium]|nr:hypothetical protein [Pseudomonadota bacterium]